MNDLLIQSEYTDIVLELLNEPYGIDSVVKVVFLAFCIRNELELSYRNRKTDFINILLDNLNIKLLSHPDELRCIFEVLNILKKCRWINIKDGKIRIVKELNAHKSENKFLIGYRGKGINPIIEVNRLDDKAFMEEVLRHV